MRPPGLQPGLHPPNLPQISKCTRYPLIKLPNRLAAAFDLEEGLPAPQLTAYFFRQLCYKRTKGSSWWGGCFKSGSAHSHMHVCTRHVSSRGAELFLQVGHQTCVHSAVPSTCEALLSPNCRSHTQYFCLVSFVTACCCFTFPYAP